VDAILATAERGLSELPRGTTPEVEAPAPEPANRFAFRKHKASQTSLSVCYRAPGRQHALEPATEMLMRILDDGMSTRVYHRICDELGLCYDAGAGYQAFDDVGVLEFGADTAHERAPQLLQVILEIGEQLAHSGPDSDELERARRRCRWQFRAMLDEPEALAHYYAYTSLMGDESTLAERCETLCDVTQAEVLRAAQAIFVAKHRSVAAIGLGRPKQQERLQKLSEA